MIIGHRRDSKAPHLRPGYTMIEFSRPTSRIEIKHMLMDTDIQSIEIDRSVVYKILIWMSSTKTTIMRTGNAPIFIQQIYNHLALTAIDCMAVIRDIPPSYIPLTLSRTSIIILLPAYNQMVTDIDCRTKKCNPKILSLEHL